MAEKDLNQEVIDYILSQEIALSDALRAGNLSSAFRSQLELELLLIRGAKIMATFYVQENSIGTLARDLTEARIITVGRLNPDAAQLGILNLPVEEVPALSAFSMQQPVEGQKG